MIKKVASVNLDRCAACGACANVCPKGAVSVWKGCYAAVSEDICVGCGICAGICPAGCISVVSHSGETEAVNGSISR